MPSAAIDSSSCPAAASKASFAGVLASMAAPQPSDFGWNDDSLAEDVATISYEQALRTHTRPQPGTQTVPGESTYGASRLPSDSAPDPRPLKTASITIRLSEPECAQLRRRAAEAGLTVSGYLRSCTLEVETLRSEVKETLAQLRRPATISRSSDPEPGEPLGGVLERLWRWLCHLVPRRRPAIGLNPHNPFAPARN